MLSAQSDLTRVESWTQEVERHTRQCKKAFRLAETGRMGRDTNPHSLAPREALGEITFNSRPRKRRRAPSTMPDSEDAAANTGKKKIKLPDVIEAPISRGRGRPRKEQPAPSNDGSMPLRQRLSSSHPILPPPTKPASAPRSRSASPRKTSIDMSYLLECNPKVRRRTYKQIYQDGDGERIPDSVRLLYQRLAKVAKNAIPSELKATYKDDANTPRKTKLAPDDHEFLPINSTTLPLDRLHHLKETLDLVLEKSQQNEEVNAHKRQWGILIVWLVGELERWPEYKHFTLLNAESCAITPLNRPQMKNGQPLPCETESVGGHTTTSNGDQGLTMARIIDWCLGFVMSKEDRDVILQAYASCLLDEDDCSLNQSRAFIKAWSLFLDFEIKKVLSLRDPLVQLAIWNSAPLIKKRRHRWDTSFPVPAIAVNGPSWDLYLFFEMNGDLIMMGPLHMGNTSDLNGLWQIVHRLHILVEWGANGYSQWFQDNIIRWARELVCIT